MQIRDSIVLSEAFESWYDMDFRILIKVDLRKLPNSYCDNYKNADF